MRAPVLRFVLAHKRIVIVADPAMAAAVLGAASDTQPPLLRSSSLALSLYTPLPCLHVLVLVPSVCAPLLHNCLLSLWVCVCAFRSIKSTTNQKIAHGKK